MTKNLSDFPLSKRAKDGHNYVEKKKEESGNITYIYDEKHVKERNKKKAKQLNKLSKSLTKLRAQLKKDITNEDDRVRLPALATALMDETYERVGNRYSAADLSHYGVTTWLVKHIKFSGSTARIKYVGKSGVKQDKTVKNAKVVKALKELCKGKKPSDLVFEIENFTLSDNNVNQYLRPFDITAKDIRGLHANVEVRKQLQKMPKGKDEKERKENFKKAVEEAAEIVGHKASTLKGQYLIPGFEEKYISKGEIIGPKTANRDFSLSKRATDWSYDGQWIGKENLKKFFPLSTFAGMSKENMLWDIIVYAPYEIEAEITFKKFADMGIYFYIQLNGPETVETQFSWTNNFKGPKYATENIIQDSFPYSEMEKKAPEIQSLIAHFTLEAEQQASEFATSPLTKLFPKYLFNNWQIMLHDDTDIVADVDIKSKHYHFEARNKGDYVDISVDDRSILYANNISPEDSNIKKIKTFLEKIHHILQRQL